MSARILAVVALAACAAEPGELSLGAVEQDVAFCADSPTTVYGIDVSRFQGTIDWQQVASSGVVYAYIQISRSLTDIDANFPYNWAHAKSVGILRGAYQRFHPGQDVAGQASLFLQKLGTPQAGDLPPLLDIEDTDGLPAATIAHHVQQWLDIVEPAVGLKPIIYTGFYYWRDSVGGADFKSYPLWIANYGASCPLVPPTWTRWAFHQYSSSAVIPGITSNTVDVDKFNGTLAELKALAVKSVCGDGSCGSNETNDSCAADCPPCQTISAGADIVDDSGACFHAGGDPQFIRTESAGYSSSLRWTHTTDAATPANFGEWTLYFAEAGRYRVEAFTPAPSSQSKHATYNVRHDGMDTQAEIDQTAVDGWNLVGELDFAAGGNQSIRVNDNTGEPNSMNTQLVFDALRFTRIAEMPPMGSGSGSGSDGPVGSGCAASGGSSSLAALGVALFGFKRRPRRHR